MYLFPNIHDLLDSLDEAKIFSILDAVLGYWQVQVVEDSITKTRFIIKYSIFEYLRMPFRLTIVPCIFEQLMENVLSLADLL